MEFPLPAPYNPKIQISRYQNYHMKISRAPCCTPVISLILISSYPNIKLSDARLLIREITKSKVYMYVWLFNAV